MMDNTCIFMSILMIVADGFTVHGPSGPLFAPLGSSLVLPCYVDELLVMEDLEVQWTRTDSETQVHLFLDGESRPESQQQEYRDRANFFTDQIQHGNFSLRLDNLTVEDEGEYICKVYSQQGSGETVVQIKHERLIVSGSDRSVSAYDGEDVTLSCSVDSHITPEHIEEVSWIRTDGDIPVLLYQNNETFSDSTDEQYRDRVEFFSAEIPKGNFSLRLKSVRTEDKGVYMCHVFAGGLSANATVVMEQLGFSSWHIAVLFFCFAAGSGAVLLLCSLIYCRSKNTVTSSIIWTLQVSLIFCPNICMFFAFMLWGFTEGSLHETVTCCALCILRPVMLMWALRYLKFLQDSLTSWIRCFRITHELTVLTVIVYSVLFAYGWRNRAIYGTYTQRISSGVFFGVVVVSSLFLSGVMRRSCVMRIVDNIVWLLALCILLSFSQLSQLITSFGHPTPVFPIVPFVQPPVLWCIPILTCLQARFKCLRRRWITILWIIIVTLLDIILVIYAHLVILRWGKEYLEWICVISFIEVLKITVFVETCVLKRMLKDLTYEEILTKGEHSRDQRRRRQTDTNQQRSNTLARCNEIMFMFGAVGLVLLNSVTLTAELILKARNGERVMKDLRVIVFPSESVFVLCWLILQTHAYWRTVTTGSTHNQRNSHRRGQLMNTPETLEMEILSAADPDVSQTQT